jgi:hypothetical protein
MFQAIIFVVLAFWGWQTFFGDKSGCDEYASNYSCKYVTEKATYEVWYWFDVNKNNPDDDKYIGTAIGLSNCRNVASPLPRGRTPASGSARACAQPRLHPPPGAV